MPAPNRINQRTGKRFDFVDPAHQDAETVALRRSVAALERQAAINEARERFMPFIKFTSPDPEAPNDITRSSYKNAKHHDATARALEEVEKGNYEFLILVEPPRHGKSEQVSRKLPAWYIGRHPKENVVVSTYSDEFAEDFGENVRTLINSPAYKQVFPKVKLARGSAAKNKLKTTEGGQIFFVGRGGALTGRGAHLLICDDLIKDDKEAQSPAIRDQAWNWLTKVALTRRMGRKLVILTFTRWHSDDPIGRLTDPENPHYSARLAKTIKIINLPAIAEDNDPLGRMPGEPLWPDGPDKFDLPFLHQQQDLDATGFAALYQGRPSAVDGDLFKRENVRYYTKDELPETLRIYASSDHAVGLKQKNDPSCLLIAGIDNQSNIYLLDCFWQRAKTDFITEQMLTMAELKKPLLWWAEAGHISKSIGPFLRKRMVEREVYINIREITPSQDKPTRAQSFAGRFAMGKVYFPKDALWTERAVGELLAFPNGLHDDFVDACSLIGLGLQSQFKPGKSASEKKKPQPAYGTVNWLKQHDKWTAEKKAEASARGF
ncbi:phage terminase large subunit [Bradyrhizobium sp. PMVTL-01]|uniref:phage terminase large subunit n=1 Tax=Bradyrhizobium sp. PMVTL-01 TaxID=3434999 RepID=UPI003F717102